MCMRSVDSLISPFFFFRFYFSVISTPNMGLELNSEVTRSTVFWHKTHNLIAILRIFKMLMFSILVPVIMG